MPGSRNQHRNPPKGVQEASTVPIREFSTGSSAMAESKARKRSPARLPAGEPGLLAVTNRRRRSAQSCRNTGRESKTLLSLCGERQALLRCLGSLATGGAVISSDGCSRGGVGWHRAGEHGETERGLSSAKNLGGTLLTAAVAVAGRLRSRDGCPVMQSWKSWSDCSCLLSTAARLVRTL